MMYYSQKKSIKDGVAQTPNNRYGTEKEMEYQYCLYRASAVKNDADEELISVEWGTIEGGAIERKVYTKPIPDMTPPEPEPEEGGDEE